MAREFTFVDLGCGKGRAMILAAEHGFRRVVGVDLVDKLIVVARANLEKLSISAELIVGDALTFTFPNENLVVFMFNPFGPEIVKKIIDRLLVSHGNKFVVYIVYINPVQAECLSKLKVITRTGSYGIWCIGGMEARIGQYGPPSLWAAKL